MASLSTSGTSSATFQVDAFGYVQVNAPSSAVGTVAFASQATNLRSSVTEALRTRRYGPYGVPGMVTITVTVASATYTYTAGYGSAIQTDADTGDSYLAGPEGTQYPMVWVVGALEEGSIAGSPRAMLMIDSGADDEDHAQILIAPNVWASGDPSTPDDALASTRLANYATEPTEVLATAIDGMATATAFERRFPLLTNLYFGLAGESSYTVAAGYTCTADDMVRMDFDEDDQVVAAQIRLASAYLGTTGMRYREIIVTPYSNP